MVCIHLAGLFVLESMPNIHKAQAAVKRARARYRKKRTKKNYAAYTSALLALAAVGVATVVASSHTEGRAEEVREEDVVASSHTKERRSNKGTNKRAPVTNCLITPSTTHGTRVSTTMYSSPSKGYPIDMRPNVRKALKNECQFCNTIVDKPGTQCEDCYNKSRELRTRRKIRKGIQQYQHKQRWERQHNKI